MYKLLLTTVWVLGLQLEGNSCLMAGMKEWIPRDLTRQLLDQACTRILKVPFLKWRQEQELTGKRLCKVLLNTPSLVKHLLCLFR